MTKKFLIMLALLVSFGSSVFSANFAINSKDLKAIEAPHYYEFDKLENPNSYYWCGHTALKIVLEANAVYKTLNDIHDDFYYIDHDDQKWRQYAYNSNACNGGHWCAFPKLLEYSILKYRTEERANIYYYRYSYTNKDNAFNFIKKQINNKHLVIIFSDRFYRYQNKRWYKTGHFFVVNGYNTKGKNKWLYVRDPDNDEPDYWFADAAFRFDDIWNNAKHKSSLVLLVIK